MKGLGTVQASLSTCRPCHAILSPSTREWQMPLQGSAFSYCWRTLFQLAVFRGALRRDLLLDLGLPLFLARDLTFHCGDCGGLEKKMYSQWKEKALEKCPPPPKNTYDLSGSDKHKMSFPWSWASTVSEKESNTKKFSFFQNVRGSGWPERGKPRTYLW